MTSLNSTLMNSMKRPQGAGLAKNKSEDPSDSCLRIARRGGTQILGCPRKGRAGSEVGGGRAGDRRAE